MDNASKALIMAGAILISVAIVGIGIYIFSTANALTDDAVGQIDSLAVSSVNSRLQTYFGSDVRGSEVQQLVREVNAMNAANSMPTVLKFSTDTQAGIFSKGAPDNTPPVPYELEKSGTIFKSNARYTVSATEYDSAGYIKTIKITKNS